jgi:hypothetical protein
VVQPAVVVVGIDSRRRGTPGGEVRRRSRVPRPPGRRRRPWCGVGVLSALSSGAALLGSGAIVSSRQRRGLRLLVPRRRCGGAPLPFSFPLLLFFLYFSSLYFSDLAAAQRGKSPRCGCAGGGGGLVGEAEQPSYGAPADTAHGQFCPAAIHGIQAMAATWSASCGPPLGFGGAVQGQRGQFPPGRASEAGAGAPARLGVRAGHGPARSVMRASVCTAGGGRKSHKHR